MSQNNQEVNIEVFNELFGSYRQRFIRFASSYIADAAVAEDIVMDSFVAAWENRRALSVASFPAYTLTAVKNRCLNHLRGQSVRMRAAEDIHSHGARMMQTRIATLQACDPEELFSEETRRLVQATLDSLPERTREIFVRSRFRGQSYKQIASEMDCTVKSVEFEVSKAMKRLRINLKDYLIVFLFLITID